MPVSAAVFGYQTLWGILAIPHASISYSIWLSNTMRYSWYNIHQYQLQYLAIKQHEVFLLYYMPVSAPVFGYQTLCDILAVVCSPLLLLSSAYFHWSVSQLTSWHQSTLAG